MRKTKTLSWGPRASSCSSTAGTSRFRTAFTDTSSFSPTRLLSMSDCVHFSPLLRSPFVTLVFYGSLIAFNGLYSLPPRAPLENLHEPVHAPHRAVYIRCRGECAAPHSPRGHRADECPPARLVEVGNCGIRSQGLLLPPPCPFTTWEVGVPKMMD